MAARLQNIAVDAKNSYELAQFWANVLDFVPDEEHPLNPDMEENFIGPRDGKGPGLLFMNVPESKTIKNRLHLDMDSDGDRDAEVQRIVDLGATVVETKFYRDDGSGWMVLADPEGNEFCVIGTPLEAGH